MRIPQTALLREALDNLAREADTAEMLLRNDYPGEAVRLRKAVTEAKAILRHSKGGPNAASVRGFVA